MKILGALQRRAISVAVAVGFVTAAHASAHLAPGTGAGASQFDGVYRGTMTSVGRGGQGTRCRASQDDAAVIVRDGVVRRRWSGNPVEAAVRPDGSFGTASGVARMRGRITGQGMSMDLEINGPACIEHYTLAGFVAGSRRLRLAVVP